MTELRHEWNKMQVEETRARIARDTIKHRDRRIRELEREVTALSAALRATGMNESLVQAILYEARSR